MKHYYLKVQNNIQDLEVDRKYYLWDWSEFGEQGKYGFLFGFVLDENGKRIDILDIYFGNSQNLKFYEYEND